MSFGVFRRRTALVIPAIENPATDRPFAWSVNWREGLAAPYESLWSILHKFAYLNAASASEVQRLFAEPGCKPWQARNLSTGRHLDLHKLSDAISLRIPLNLISQFARK